MRVVAFADVLDAELRMPAPPAASHAPGEGIATDAFRAAVFAQAPFAFNRTPYARLPRVDTPPLPPPAVPGRAVVASRVAPSATPGQLRALDLLMGQAPLRAGTCTPDELRWAFRRLARECHPDRHPGADERARARLCRAFARLTDSYRELLARLDPPGPARH